MKFEENYFISFKFTKEQVKKNFDNTLKDFNIAKKDKILEVKFTYAYTAFIKAGMALLSFYNTKVRSVPGHHAKLIEKMSKILKDDAIYDMGDVMRSKRNIDFYGGGIEISEKECCEFFRFVENVIDKIKCIISE